MKCESARQRLLSLPEPRQLPHDLLAHVRACSECRHQWDRLVALERAVRQLPVPASDLARASLLHRLAGNAPTTLAPRVNPWPDRLATLARHRSVIAATAAALLIAVAGLAWWSNTGSGPAVARTPTDTLMARMHQHYLDQATAPDARKRAEALAELADDLHGQSRTLSRVATGDDLKFLATQYRKVVFDGLVIQARRVDVADRKQVARELEERLLKTGREAETLAGEVPAGSAAALRDIAETAREAGKQLRTLTAEGGAT